MDLDDFIRLWVIVNVVLAIDVALVVIVYFLFTLIVEAAL